MRIRRTPSRSDDKRVIVKRDEATGRPVTLEALKQEILEGKEERQVVGDGRDDDNNDDKEYDFDSNNNIANTTTRATTTTTKRKDRAIVRKNSKDHLIDQYGNGVKENNNNNNNSSRNNRISKYLFNASSTDGNMNNRMPIEIKNQLKLIYYQFGPDAHDVLKLIEEDGMPSPEQPDHVIVKVQASTVTLQDCLIRRGFDFDVLNPISVPQTPGFDIVGHIVACGYECGTFMEGDRVAALVRTGGNARYVSVPASSLVSIPRHVDAAEAAALVSIYTTAYQTLKRITQKGPTFSLLGKRVLILGGMDGVGQALIQMCGKARAEIFATAPNNRHAYVQNVLGAIPLPENKEKWLPLVEGKMDYVFDGLCEDGLDTSCLALKEHGELVCYGHTAMLRHRHMGFLGAPMSAHINNLWSRTYPQAKFVEIWDSFQSDPDVYKKNLKSLCQLLKWNKLKPHIAKRVCLSEVAEAQNQLERGEIRGTVVCLPWKKIADA